MAARLRRYFITGLLSTLPIAVTLYFLWWVYNWSNSLIEGILRIIGAEPARWLSPFLPILGILATLGLVTLVGALAGNYVGRLVPGRHRPQHQDHSPGARGLQRRAADRPHPAGPARGAVPAGRPHRVPPQGPVYPVFYRQPSGRQAPLALARGLYTVVLVPTSPVPASGMAIIVPTADVIPLDVSIEDALKYVVSAGFILPSPRAKQLLESGSLSPPNPAPSANPLWGRCPFPVPGPARGIFSAPLGWGSTRVGPPWEGRTEALSTTPSGPCHIRT
ncbi:MAG: hypothetical protein KatS3mg071_2212 [Meiothermus sp.]|nr:MAG: hypothetical protein KatS3mg071_2212 [Meiothermus sp.]